jgi:hypothetical protein
VIEWPNDWEEDEGGGLQKRRPLTLEDRLWASLFSYSQKNLKLSRVQLVERLGGVVRSPTLHNWDIEALRQELTFLGARPSTYNSPRWAAADTWLRNNHDTSLAGLCDSLGLISNRTSWDWRSIDSCIRSYYKTHKRRPSATSSKRMATIHTWLASRGTSLSKHCDKLGLPPVRIMRTSLPHIRAEVRTFVKEQGQRPSLHSPHWRNVDSWLIKRGSSLATLCNDLRIEGGQNRSRSIPNIKTQARQYYTKHSRRPTSGTSKEWSAIDGWLIRQGTSLAQMLNNLGLENSRGPTTEQIEQRCLAIRKEARIHKREHSRRPTEATSSQWKNQATWLRKHLDMGLSAYLDEVGIL